MEKNKKIIVIISPKGGAGKTVTTANLALSLANDFGKKILAIDTNMTSASLGLHLNMLYPHVTIYDIIRKNFPVSKTISTYNENLDIIPAPTSIEKKDKDFKKLESNIREVTERYDDILKILIKDYDIILLDSAPGFNVESIAALRVADYALVVTNPDYPSIVATAKSIIYAKSLKIPVLGIVLTKISDKKYELSREDIEKALKTKVIKKIPYNDVVGNSIANKTPVVEFSPSSDVAIAYKELAGSLIGQNYTTNFKQKIRRFLKR